MTNVSDGDRVREQLIDAVSSGDQRRLTKLCKAHRETIRRDFPDWTQVPAELRADPALVQKYAGTLISVAQLFASQFGDPALLEAITGPPETHPIAQWQGALGQAQELMGQLRFAEARQLLSQALTQARQLQGPAVDSLLPITYGKLGECCFQLGEAAAALDLTTTALRLCEEQGDTAGILAYQGNLFEIHRYLGQAEPAALAAERHAETLTVAGQAGQAAAWRKQAQLVRAGEPLNRVVVVIDGGEFELDEVPMPPQEKARLAEAALRMAPRLAPLHLFHGRALEMLGAKDAAEAAYRDGLDCASEPDIRTRLLVALSVASSSAQERTAALREAAAMVDGNLISAAMATIALRAAR